MRPPGPDPATVARSMPASRARRRLAGEVMIRPPTGAADAAVTGAAASGVARPGAQPAPRRSAAGLAAGGLAAAAVAAGAVSNTINGEPTAILSPGAPRMESTRPLTGAGTSTAALSVITSTMI